MKRPVHVFILCSEKTSTVVNVGAAIRIGGRGTGQCVCVPQPGVLGGVSQGLYCICACDLHSSNYGECNKRGWQSCDGTTATPFCCTATVITWISHLGLQLCVYTEYRAKFVGPVHRIINNDHILIMHGWNCTTPMHNEEVDCRVM